MINRVYGNMVIKYGNMMYMVIKHGNMVNMVIKQKRLNNVFKIKFTR